MPPLTTERHTAHPKRSGAACTNCRAHKQRCDDSRIPCRRCELYRIPCSFETDPPKPKRSRTKKTDPTSPAASAASPSSPIAPQATTSSAPAFGYPSDSYGSGTSSAPAATGEAGIASQLNQVLNRLATIEQRLQSSSVTGGQASSHAGSSPEVDRDHDHHHPRPPSNPQFAPGSSWSGNHANQPTLTPNPDQPPYVGYQTADAVTRGIITERQATALVNLFINKLDRSFPFLLPYSARDKHGSAGGMRMRSPYLFAAVCLAAAYFRLHSGSRPASHATSAEGSTSGEQESQRTSYAGDNTGMAASGGEEDDLQIDEPTYILLTEHTYGVFAPVLISLTLSDVGPDLVAAILCLVAFKPMRPGLGPRPTSASLAPSSSSSTTGNFTYQTPLLSREAQIAKTSPLTAALLFSAACRLVDILRLDRVLEEFVSAHAAHRAHLGLSPIPPGAAIGSPTSPRFSSDSRRSLSVEEASLTASASLNPRRTPPSPAFSVAAKLYFRALMLRCISGAGFRASPTGSLTLGTMGNLVMGISTSARLAADFGIMHGLKRGGTKSEPRSYTVEELEIHPYTPLPLRETWGNIATAAIADLMESVRSVADLGVGFDVASPAGQSSSLPNVNPTSSPTSANAPTLNERVPLTANEMAAMDQANAALDEWERYWHPIFTLGDDGTPGGGRGRVQNRHQAWATFHFFYPWMRLAVNRRVYKPPRTPSAVPGGLSAPPGFVPTSNPNTRSSAGSGDPSSSDTAAEPVFMVAQDEEGGRYGMPLDGRPLTRAEWSSIYPNIRQEEWKYVGLATRAAEKLLFSMCVQSRVGWEKERDGPAERKPSKGTEDIDVAERSEIWMQRTVEWPICEQQSGLFGRYPKRALLDIDEEVADLYRYSPDHALSVVIPFAVFFLLKLAHDRYVDCSLRPLARGPDGRLPVGGMLGGCDIGEDDRLPGAQITLPDPAATNARDERGNEVLAIEYLLARHYLIMGNSKLFALITLSSRFLDFAAPHPDSPAKRQAALQRDLLRMGVDQSAMRHRLLEAVMEGKTVTAEPIGNLSGRGTPDSAGLRSSTFAALHPFVSHSPLPGGMPGMSSSSSPMLSRQDSRSGNSPSFGFGVSDVRSEPMPSGSNPPSGVGSAFAPNVAIFTSPTTDTAQAYGQAGPSAAAFSSFFSGAGLASSGLPASNDMGQQFNPTAGTDFGAFTDIDTLFAADAFLPFFEQAQAEFGNASFSAADAELGALGGSTAFDFSSQGTTGGMFGTRAPQSRQPASSIPNAMPGAGMAAAAGASRVATHGGRQGQSMTSSGVGLGQPGPGPSSTGLAQRTEQETDLAAFFGGANAFGVHGYPMQHPQQQPQQLSPHQQLSPRQPHQHSPHQQRQQPHHSTSSQQHQSQQQQQRPLNSGGMDVDWTPGMHWPR